MKIGSINLGLQFYFVCGHEQDARASWGIREGAVASYNYIGFSSSPNSSKSVYSEGKSMLSLDNNVSPEI